jgi:hypothetical protein
MFQQSKRRNVLRAANSEHVGTERARACSRCIDAVWRNLVSRGLVRFAGFETAMALLDFAVVKLCFGARRKQSRSRVVREADEALELACCCA